MYIEVVPNRRSRPAVLLREGWREGTKVCKRTLANLSDWEPHRVDALAAVLMRRALTPILFDDDDKPAGEALRPSVVAPARRSPRADAKGTTKRTSDGGPVHGFTTLLRDLATVVRNRVQPRADGSTPFDVITRPTPNQKRALDLLNVSL